MERVLEIDLDHLRMQAREALAPGAMAFCDCGADDEVTVAANEAAWRVLSIRPRMLRDIAGATTHTTILGAPATMPIMIAPSGRHALFHPGGERSTARGAAGAGAIYVMSTSANVTIEDVAAERGQAGQWFQLYVHPDRALTESLIGRAARAGFGAIVLTVDQPVAGWSPRAVREPITDSTDRYVNLPGAPLARSAYDVETRGKPRFPVTIDDLAWLCARTPLPLIVKGVLRGDDALRCMEAGARGIIVSNHGGRHLDTAVSTAHALSDVAQAVAGGADIYVDGGIRRGTDIFKALCLGAKAVLIGRPVLWALAVDGAAGVQAMLQHLRDDLLRTMRLSGVRSLDEVGPDLVVREYLDLKAEHGS